MIYDVTIGKKTHRVELVRSPAGWRCKLDSKEFAFDATSLGNGSLSILVDGNSYEVRQENTPGDHGLEIVVGRQRFPAVVRDPRSLRSRGSREAGGQGPRKITAPMPGKVVRIVAAVGSELEAGQPVLVIEAMKMQNELKSPKKGKLSKVYVGEGAAVEAGQTLAEIE